MLFSFLKKRTATEPELPAYHVRLLRPETLDDGTELWAATFEELDGCIGQGQTSGEAEAMLWRILPGYLAEMRKHGATVPSPIRAPGIQIYQVASATALHAGPVTFTGEHVSTSRSFDTRTEARAFSL